MSDRPIVSVFMPAYNQEQFISEAIESALQQGIDDMEIIIGDDCSSDRTWVIIQSYAEKYPHAVVAFRNERNLGITGNCNEVLSRCRGKYIAFHAGDDIWLPGKLKTQIALMESDEKVLLTYHDMEVFDSDSNKVLYYWNRGGRRPKAIEGSSEYVLSKLIEHSAGFLGALSVVIRKSALPDRATYDERLPHLSELSMWVNVLHERHGYVRYIPEVLARYRKHSNGISQNNNDVEYDIFLAIIENEFPDLIIPVRKARCIRYYRMGVRSVLQSKRKQALLAFSISIRNGFFSFKIIYWILRAALKV